MHRLNSAALMARRAIAPAGAALFILLTGCTTSQGVAPPRQHDTPVQELSLSLPENLDIVSVDYDVEYSTEAATAAAWFRTGWLDLWSDAWAFVKVHAYDRTTGDAYLLIYLDSTERSEPVQVIRFERRPTPPSPPTEVSPMHEILKVRH